MEIEYIAAMNAAYDFRVDNDPMAANATIGDKPRVRVAISERTVLDDVKAAVADDDLLFILTR